MLHQIRRQESESEEHYNLFIQYLFAKRNRSIRFIADENNISERQIYRISNTHNWKARLNSHVQEENQMLKAEFALAQKETLREKLDVLTSTDSQILEVKNMLLYKGREFLPKDLPAEKYIKRANTYLTVQLKIQKFDKNFSDHIENYDISENSELEDLKDMIEREMNKENKNENENLQINLPKHDTGEYKKEKTNPNLPKPDTEKARHSECNAVERRIQSAQSEASLPKVSQNRSNIQSQNENSQNNMPKPDIENEYYKNPPDYSAISCHSKSDDPELQSVFDRLQ